MSFQAGVGKACVQLFQKHGKWQRFKEYFFASGHVTREDLPVSVLSSLAVFQERSEVVVVTIQLLMMLAIGAAIAMAPVEHTSVANLSLVQMGLCLLGLLAAVRLWVAIRIGTPAWLLALSIIAETVLFTLTLWAYHRQWVGSNEMAGDNAYFTLVILQIVLRGLRVQPIWVLFSGTMVLLCWFGVGYLDCISGIGGGCEVLVGALSKYEMVLSILAITLVLSLVLLRAKNTLLEAAGHTEMSKNLARFFDKAVAEQIALSDTEMRPGHGVSRQAAILFTDLRGFTYASSKLSPDGLIALLQEYQQLVVPIIQAHGGNIDKFMGDGILASFGAIADSTTYAADALRAVDDILMAVKFWQMDRSSSGLITVDIGAGVGIGEVVFAVIGDETRMEYTVIGGTVNLAAKLEKHNKETATKALTTRLGFEKAIEQGYAKTEKLLLENCEVSGVDLPVDLIKLG